MQRFLVLILITALFPALGATCRNEGSPATAGNPAPPFTLTDINGNRVRLADFSGKVVVLDFWATWCGPCREATAELEDIHRTYIKRGVSVVGISIDEGKNAKAVVREFASKNKLSYLVLLDNDGHTKKAYGVTRIPTTFVLDQKHIIREIYPGFRSGIGRQISLDIEKLL